ADLEARVRERIANDDGTTSRLHRAGNVDSFILDLMAQAERIEGRMKRNRRQVEELVADAAHGHISIERMRALGAEHVREQLELEAELAAARERIAAQQGETERRKHLDALRQSLVTGWDTLEFSELRERLREVIDRVEVDGEDMRLLLRP